MKCRWIVASLEIGKAFLRREISLEIINKKLENLGGMEILNFYDNNE